MTKQTFEQFARGGEVTNNISFEEFSGGANVKSVLPQSEPEKLSFVQRVGEDLKKRMAIANEI